MVSPCRISVAIITFNEEKTIRQVLESVDVVADEIVVVDSYSTDRTPTICKEMGAKVISQKFLGYIEQKNFALECCSYDYVLSLDGDEILSKTLRDSIFKVKSDWKGKGYRFNRLTNYVGHWVRWCGWYPDEKLRLVDRRYARWGGVNPHDILILDDGSCGTHLKGDLYHYSYHSVSDHIEQTNRFTTISAKAYFEQGVRSNLFKIVTRPVLKFLRDYFWKRGFLDGKYGFIICVINGLSAFLKYVKIREIQTNGADLRD